ncbi:MAG TPA: amidase [Rhizomicrobium sp.]|jgi:amidase|nr:amidase [Rhizomicrobium sp.]
MTFRDYGSYDALGLAALVKARKVKPSEILDEAIARAEALNPALNAIVFTAYDTARAAAKAKLSKGVFAGVPMLLKDMRAHVAGWPTRSGSRYVPATPALADSTIVTHFKAAGLIPFGKTNVPEFGILPTTESKLYGAARNPWNLAHSTGGSSGGSAAAVAAGIVPIAHATDGGGSIRIPASACGLVGLKASRGRISQGPDFADATSGLSMDGVVTKSVRDTAAALDAVCGIDYGDPYFAPPPEGSYLAGIRRKGKRLRIAVSTRMMNGTAHHPEVTAAVRKTAKLCESLGHHVEETDPPIDAGALVNAFSLIWAANVAYSLAMLQQQTGKPPSLDVIEGLTMGLYEIGKPLSAVQLTMARQTMMRAGRQMAKWHETYDVWLTATLGRPPMKLGTIDVDETDVQKGFAPNFGYVPFTSMQNSTGTPGINLPLNWGKDGLPLGVQFTARAGGEMILLRLAAELEKAAPWAHRYSELRI